ncbi:hypothetical protein ACI6Q2_19785 [Chitinophagaceae bacterium LWZ2-11]
MLLEAKLMDAAKNTNNIESLLDNAVKSLVTLDQLYKDGNVKKKRQIIGSIFPQNSFLTEPIIESLD